MPLWQAQNLSNTVLKADTEQPHIDHGVDITRILLGHRFTMEPLKNSTTRIFRLTHKEFLEIMPEIMGIKSLPDLSEQHPEAYRVRDGREFNAIATRMHYGHAPVRAIDASGADLGDMTFGEFFSDGDIFVDGADLRRTRFHRDRQASGQRLSMNRSIVGLGDFDLKNWLDSSCEFDVVRVHLTSLYVTDELLERARQYDQDARDDGIITLTRAEFAEWLARDWYGIEDFR